MLRGEGEDGRRIGVGAQGHVAVAQPQQGGQLVRLVTARLLKRGARILGTLCP